MNEEPLVRVVRGAPTPEELAALVTVLAARSTTADEDPRKTSMTPWVRSARPAAGPGSWRASALPGIH
jgi:hypothetical protein